MLASPDYAGGSLLNLMGELERRLIGSAPNPGLHPGLAGLIPDAASYVLVLFDGLGESQLSHPAAAALREAHVGAIDAGWPTTTTVSMATIATGLSPAQHGLLGYQLRIPETGYVVNTIKWITLWGQPIEYDTDGFLPAPNLWERLREAGKEPVTLQPWAFDDTPMSNVLYRGCRFEPWADEDEAAHAAAQLAAEPGRLVLLYIPHVDVAAHVDGQQSDDYAEAMTIVSAMWERLLIELPAHAVAVGSADHGHVDVGSGGRLQIPRHLHEEHEYGGDPRAPFVYGDPKPVAEALGIDWLPRSEMEHWWGPGQRHPGFEGRAPDGVLLPPPGAVALHKHADDRLIGHHGGLSDEERRVPLLVGQ